MYHRILNHIIAFPRYKFSLGTFLVPLIIRAIPEFLAGPYPIGWDVITYYVPNLFDIASGNMNAWGIIASTPVMYAIVVPIYLLTGASPILIFKILGPILYGLLGWSIFRFCQRRLQWQDSKSFYAVLFVSAYFVMMRISWDAYRMELGLAFLLLAESIVDKIPSRKSELNKLTLLSLAVLSNQLVGVLVAGTIVVRLLRSLTSRNLRLVALQIPPGSLFLWVLYAMMQTPLATGLTVVGAETNIAGVPSTVLFLLYAYVGVIPLLFLGVRSHQRSVFTTWVAVCILGIAASVLPGHVFQDIAYRWVLLLSIPILILAYEGYTNLQKICLSSAKRWTRPLRLALITSLAVSASLFAVLPAQSAFPFYTAFTQYVPSSMVQSSLPSSDYSHVVSAMIWINTHTNSDSVVITQQAFYGWARNYLSPGKVVVNCYLASPTSAIGDVRSYNHVFTVWWTNGTGWFQASFPTGARPVVSFGDLVVYQYR